MTPENFCYWLQGKLEIDGNIESLNKEQIEIINDHLKLVFNKVTPERGKKETLSALEKTLNNNKSIFPDFKPTVYC